MWSTPQPGCSCRHDNCGTLTNQNINVGGYAVTFNVACVGHVPYVVNSVTVNVYTVTVTSSRGVYGTPEFVARSSTLRVSSL